MSVADLPLVNACLNSTSTILLTIGYAFIKRKNQPSNRNCMVAAFITSTVFLASYLYYHYHVGHTAFTNPPWFRRIYIPLLISHIILAALIVPLILGTILFAFMGWLDAHKRIARWTWPLWMYVSITGVAIYFILYQIFPQAK